MVIPGDSRWTRVFLISLKQSQFPSTRKVDSSAVRGVPGNAVATASAVTPMFTLRSDAVKRFGSLILPRW